jgi:hypothetical protein
MEIQRSTWLAAGSAHLSLWRSQRLAAARTRRTKWARTALAHVHGKDLRLLKAQVEVLAKVTCRFNGTALCKLQNVGIFGFGDATYAWYQFSATRTHAPDCRLESANATSLWWGL